jgi:hypothetical protein
VLVIYLPLTFQGYQLRALYTYPKCVLEKVENNLRYALIPEHFVIFALSEHLKAKKVWRPSKICAREPPNFASAVLLIVRDIQQSHPRKK